VYKYAYIYTYVYAHTRHIYIFYMYIYTYKYIYIYVYIGVYNIYPQHTHTHTHQELRLFHKKAVIQQLEIIAFPHFIKNARVNAGADGQRIGIRDKRIRSVQMQPVRVILKNNKSKKD